jgi:PPOX class probable F420-dependent enzyme
MEVMSTKEAKRFMMTGTRTGKLAVVRKDGRPLATPIWFVIDGDDVVFTTHSTSGKGRAIKRDPRVAMVVDDDTPPYSFVLVEGTVTISEDADELLHWATKIGGRYMGAGRAEEFGRRNGVAGEYLVRIHPTSIIGRAAVSD